MCVLVSCNVDSGKHFGMNLQTPNHIGRFSFLSSSVLLLAPYSLSLLGLWNGVLMDPPVFDPMGFRLQFSRPNFNPAGKPHPMSRIQELTGQFLLQDILLVKPQGPVKRQKAAQKNQKTNGIQWEEYISLHVNLIDVTSSQIRENHIIIHKCGRFMDGVYLVYLITCFPSPNCKPPRMAWLERFDFPWNKKLIFSAHPCSKSSQNGIPKCMDPIRKGGASNGTTNPSQH